MLEPGDDGPFQGTIKNPWPEQPPRRAGGVAALELRARYTLPQIHAEHPLARSCLLA
jgi:hypothetical protein